MASPQRDSASLTPPALGEGCANPKPLTFSNGAAGGTASDSASTSMLFHETNGGCSTQAANDMVYTFTTNAILDFRATATASTSTFQPVL